MHTIIQISKNMATQPIDSGTLKPAHLDSKIAALRLLRIELTMHLSSGTKEQD